MEAFNMEQQQYLDNYTSLPQNSDDVIPTETYVYGKGFAALMEAYEKSEEGFVLPLYFPLLNMARERGVRVFAGFPPRPTARLAVGGAKEVWEEAKSKRWVSQWNEGSHDHFLWFKSLFTGEEWIPPADFRGKSVLNIHDSNSVSSQQHVEQSENRTNRIFPAQVFKDSVLAERVNKILKEDKKAKVMVVCGRGHSDFWLGAPERVREPVCVLSVRPRIREYEDEKGNTHTQERTAEEVTQELDERMCDAVLIY